MKVKLLWGSLQTWIDLRTGSNEKLDWEIESGGSEDGAILEKFQQQDPSLVGRIMGALTWSLYVWRFEGQNLMHYSISLMLSWLVWSCFWKRVHPDYPRIGMAYFPVNQKWPHSSFLSLPLLHAWLAPHSAFFWETRGLMFLSKICII